MTAYYPLFEEEIKQGPPGMPGIGFKLTNDGNYDMERKILTNLNDPIQLNDSATKYYADVIQRDLKSEIEALSNASLVQNTNGEFDAKNISIKNLGKPNDDKDAVTKKYVDRRTKINDKRDDNLLKRDNEGLYVPSLIQNDHYNFDNKRLMNVSDPQEDNDSATKQYVDDLNKRCMIRNNGYFDAKRKFIRNLENPKEESDASTKQYVDELRDKSLILGEDRFDAKNRFISNVKWPEKELDAVNKQCLVYSCILWDKDKRIYYAHDQRISNVKAPQADSDCANKYYVDTKSFCATTARAVEFTGVGYKTFQFDEFSSKLLDSNLKLSQNMFMKITIFLACEKMNENPKIRLEKGKEVLLDKAMNINEDSITVFAYGKLNDVLTLSVLTGGKCKLKPYLHIEKIEFNYK